MLELYVLGNRTPVFEPDLMAWCEWMETARRSVVETRFFPSLVEVQTIFAGVDHGCFAERAPLVFVTNFTGGPVVARINRWPTWRQAERGHWRIVAEVAVELRRLTCGDS
jgi:hypothetical protein